MSLATAGRRVVFLGAVAVLTGGLAACTSEPPSAAESTATDRPATNAATWSPAATDGTVDLAVPRSPGDATVARLDERTMLLTTWGSGSCPLVPTTLDVVSDAEIAVAVHDRFADPDVPRSCTADLTPSSAVVELPAELDHSGPIVVRVNAVVLELPAVGAEPSAAPVAETWRPTDRPEPPAAWQTGGATPAEVSEVAWDDAGRILLTTWGSGSCPTVVTGVDLVSASELDLTLELRGGPECTTDMSPFVSRIEAPVGLDVTGEVTVRVGDVPVLRLPPRA